jgi:hypothetical protein
MSITSSLRSWLRRPPQPSSIRYRTEDGEERMLKLSAELKNRWRNAEEALLTAKATSVEALDDKGDVIRGTALELGENGEPLDPEEADAKREDRALSKSLRDQGILLDRYGARLNEAFREGAKAANLSHDKLVELVDILTSKLGEMINTTAGLSKDLGKLLRAKEEGGDPDEDVQKKNDEMVANLIQLGIAKFMQQGGGMGGAKPNGKTNGAPSGKEK